MLLLSRKYETNKSDITIHITYINRPALIIEARDILILHRQLEFHTLQTTPCKDGRSKREQLSIDGAV